MSEAEEMRKYAEAHGCGELRLAKLTDEQLQKWEALIDREPLYIHLYDSPVRPLPCVRDERGEIKSQTEKALIAKVDEELNEMKTALAELHTARLTEFKARKIHFADEAADTITAITTLLEALGIDAKMRDEAQRRVNAKNLERGRL